MTADTYSGSLGVILMGTGNDANSWGNNCNNSVFQIFEDAIANASTRTITGGTLDLSGTPPPTGPSQARYAAFIFNGALASNQNILVPNVTKFWWVKNSTTGGFALTFQPAAGTASSAIPQGGAWILLFCDGNGHIEFVASNQFIGGSIDLTNDPSISNSPTGNTTGGPLLTTYSTAVIQGATDWAANREFLVSIGLMSDKGSGVGNNNGDKAGLYVGVTGNSGTGNLWSTNFVLVEEASSGSYDAQVIEVDYNNLNISKGAPDGPTGLEEPLPIAYGISVSGANDANEYTGSAGIAIDSFGHANTPLWTRGLALNGWYTYATVADYSNSPIGYDARYAAHSNGLLFASSALCPNIINSLNSSSATATLMRFDTSNNLTLAYSNVTGTFIGGAGGLAPLTDNSVALGSPSNRWQTAYAVTYEATAGAGSATDGFIVSGNYTTGFDASGATIFGSVIKAPNNVDIIDALNGSAVNVTILRFDSGNNLYIGSPTTNPPAALFINSGILMPPAQTGNYNIGGTGNRYATIYSVNNLNTSDERLKKNIADEVLGLDFIMALRPISYEWNDGIHKDKGVYHGLSAQQVEVALAGHPFAGLEKPQNGNHPSFLSYSDFIGPIIIAIQEQQQKIKSLSETVEFLQDLVSKYVSHA